MKNIVEKCYKEIQNIFHVQYFFPKFVPFVIWCGKTC